MDLLKSEKVKLKVRRTFLKQGTCSRTYFYILNREFGHPKLNEEKASDLLAGGIAEQGYQCGMLWGASFAIGAEAYRLYGNTGKAISLSIKATQLIMESFKNRTGTIECYDITNCDLKKKSGLLKMFITGKPVTCLNLAAKWAPDAIKVANQGLSISESELDNEAVSCASEVARKMGATDEEMIMVAGFAGGMGLQGNGCGALSAAIWMNTLDLVKEDYSKTIYPNPKAHKTLENFNLATDYELMCSKISGRSFNSIKDHTDFINEGGCSKIIEVLSNPIVIT